MIFSTLSSCLEENTRIKVRFLTSSLSLYSQEFSLFSSACLLAFSEALVHQAAFADRPSAELAG